MKLSWARKTALKKFKKYLTLKSKKNTEELHKIIDLLLDESKNESDILPYIPDLENYENTHPELSSDAYYLLGFIFDFEIVKQENKNKKEVMKLLFKKGAEKNHSPCLANLARLLWNENKYNEAFKYLQQAVSNDDLYGYYIFGLMSFHGQGCQKDKENAIRILEQGVKHNDSGSQFLLAEILMKEKNPDYNKVLNLHERAAAQGDPESQYALYVHYYFGKGVEKDIKKAIEYCKLAATEKNSRAMVALAKAHLNGECVEKNFDLVIKLLEEASNLNNLDAKYFLSEHYSKGKIVKQDNKRAFELLEQLDAAGDARGQFCLHQFYRDGISVPKNISKAREILIKSQKQNYAEAQFYLGCYHFHGLIFNKNLKAAIHLYQLAAAQGHLKAIYALGQCYDFGTGVDKDVNRAIEYYQSAANKGDIRALETIATYKAAGKGMEKNLKEAIEIYERLLNLDFENTDDNLSILSAINNINDIRNRMEQNLVNCYGQSGPEQNLKKMIECLHKFSDKADQNPVLKGNPACQNLLADSYYSGFGVETNFKQAVKYYELSASQNNARSKYALYPIYMSGRNEIEKNEKRALEFLISSADQGHSIAKYELAKIYASLVQIDEKIKSELNLKPCLSKALDLYYQVISVGISRPALGAQSDLAKIYAQLLNDNIIYDCTEKPDFYRAYLLTLNCIKHYPHGNLANKLLLDITNKMYSKEIMPFQPKTLEEAIQICEQRVEKILNPSSDFSNKEEVILSPKKAYQDFILRERALDLLGLCYQFGIGKEQDLNLAVKCYKEAISLGNSNSLIRLWNCYKYFSKNISFKLEDVIDYFKNDTLKNDPNALLVLAEIYETGPYGYPKSPKTAIDNYQKVIALDPTHVYAKRKKNELSSFGKISTILHQFFGFIQDGKETNFSDSLCSLIAEFALESDYSITQEESKENADKPGNQDKPVSDKPDSDIPGPFILKIILKKDDDKNQNASDANDDNSKPVTVRNLFRKKDDRGDRGGRKHRF